MSYIKYGNFEFKANSGYPVPQISLSYEPERDPAGKIISAKTSITLEGVIYSASGARGFENLINRESGLRQVFQTEGKLLEIGCTGAGGISSSPYFSGIAKINRYSAERSEDRWTNTIPYTIELFVQVTGLSGIFPVSSTQDDWSIETIEEGSYTSDISTYLRGTFNFPKNLGSGYPTYRISRTIGAVGINMLPSGKSAVANAKDWVKYQATGATGVNISGIVSGLSLFNCVRSVNLSEVEGTYRITDTWIGVPSGASFAKSGYTETFSVETVLDSSYLRTITINGTVKGLEPFNTGSLYSDSAIPTGTSGSLYNFSSSFRSDNTISKFSNALSGYSGIRNRMYDRASCFLLASGDPSGLFRKYFGRDESPLNPMPLSITEGMNPYEGTVTYSWVYNNRPLNLISGSISETLTINDTFPTQQYAEIFVLGRRLGPILQDLGTWTSSNRDITFEVTFPRPTGLSGLIFPKATYQAITGIVESFNPNILLGYRGDRTMCPAFVKTNNENWYVTEGRFVKQKAWQWTKCDGTLGSNMANVNAG